MNPRRTWLLYSLIRLGLFAVLLAILILLLTPGGVPEWISAVLAAIISLCISFIFLRKPREEAARTLYEARASTKRSQSSAAGDDENNEDSVIDGAAGVSTTADTEVAGGEAAGTAAAGTASESAEAPSSEAPSDSPKA